MKSTYSDIVFDVVRHLSRHAPPFSHTIEFKISFVTAVILGITTSLFMILAFFFNIKRDPKEPPFIPQSIPYVGHLFGIIRKGESYYHQISAKYPLPVYSLSLPGYRIYIINSPDLVAAVQHHPKALMPEPFTAKHVAQVFELSKEAEKIWFDNVDLAKGDWGLNYEVVKGIRNALTLGSSDLDQISRRMLRKMTSSFEQLSFGETGEAGKTVPLMDWLRTELTMAVTSAIYGTTDPFQDQDVQNGFWDLVDNFIMLLVNVMPNMTAPVGYKGREKTFKAFEDYLGSGGPDKGSSGLFKVLLEVYQKYNIPMKDMAHFEVGNLVASAVNISPTAFWNLYHIYSDPGLLEKIRAEVTSALTVTTDKAGSESQRYLLDVTKIRTACPLLNSVFHEVLRFRAVNASFRLVMKDVMLQDRYLLKKGAAVFMPMQIIHRNTAAWGSNAHEFVADRFLQQQPHQKSHKVPQGAFNVFGGGVALCPGKQLVTTTVLAVVAMFVLRYEVRPVVKQNNNKNNNLTVNDGGWTEPKHITSQIPIIPSPERDILVEVSPREGVFEKEKEKGERASWEFKNIDSKSHHSPSLAWGWGEGGDSMRFIN